MNLLKLLLSMVIVMIIIFVISEISLLIISLATLLLAVFLISLFYPKIGLFLFILIRPILDFSTSYDIIHIGGLSLNLGGVTGVLVLIFALVTIFKKKIKIGKIRLFRSWAIFLILSFLSIFISINISSGINEMARLLTIVMMFLASFSVITTKKDLTTLIKVIILSGIIPAIVAINQFFTETGLYDDGADNRLFGTFAHPNMLGFFLVLLSSLSLFAYLKNKKEKIATNVYGLFFLIYTALLVLTFTRGAWIAFTLFIIIIGVIKFRAMIILLIVALIISYSVSLPFQERANSIINPTSYGSIDWRINLWKDELKYFKEKPLTGYGLGTASQVILSRRGPEMGSPEPHNDYLKVSMESGILTTLSYLWLISQSVLFLFLAYRKQKRPKLKFLNLFILASISGLFIMGFGDNVLNDTALQWSLWALIGGMIRTQGK